MIEADTLQNLWGRKPNAKFLLSLGLDFARKDLTR
jgi:hypothetical protein